MHQNAPWVQVAGRTETQQVRSLRSEEKNATNGAYSRRSAASAFILVEVSAHAGLGLGTTCCFKFHMGSRPTSYLKSACTGAQQSQTRWVQSERGGGGGIRSGPLVGKVAMSPLPSRGAPTLQSGGQNQKWPTCGQSGYITPPPNKMDSQGGKHSNLRLERCSFTHPFPPNGGSILPNGTPHQGTARARKNFGLRQVPGTNWFGDGGQGFSRLRLPCPPPPPPTTLLPDLVPQEMAKCPAQGDIRHVGRRKRGGIRGVPTI